MVIKQPSLAQRAHARLYNMIKRTGVQVDDEGKEHYAFFEHDLFGIDEPLARVVEYFIAARGKVSLSFCLSAGSRSIRRPMRGRYTRSRTARSTKPPLTALTASLTWRTVA